MLQIPLTYMVIPHNLHDRVCPSVTVSLTSLGLRAAAVWMPGLGLFAGNTEVARLGNAGRSIDSEDWGVSRGRCGLTPPRLWVPGDQFACSHPIRIGFFWVLWHPPTVYEKGI